MFQKQTECLLAVAGDLNAATSVGTVSTAAVCGTGCSMVTALRWVVYLSLSDSCLKPCLLPCCPWFWELSRALQVPDYW